MALYSILQHFVNPGEIFTHLLCTTNNVDRKGILAAADKKGPFVYNESNPVRHSQHILQTQNPLQINYGLSNPSLRSMVVYKEQDLLVPMFSYSPCIPLRPDQLEDIVNWASTLYEETGLVVLPAVHGKVYRVFYVAGHWWLADNSTCVKIGKRWRQPIIIHLEWLLGTTLLQYVSGLNTDLVWFFTIYHDEMLILGTLPLRGEIKYQSHMHFNTETLVDIARSPMCSVASAEWSHPRYNGLFVFNPETLGGVRLCSAEVVFMRQVICGQIDIQTLCAFHVLKTRSLCANDHIPLVAEQWFMHTCVQLMTDIQDVYPQLLSTVSLYIDNPDSWIPGWLAYIRSDVLWNKLSYAQQYLFVILEHTYVQGKSTRNIIFSPQYISGIASMISSAIKMQPRGYLCRYI